MTHEPRTLLEKKPLLRAAQVREARLKAALKANMARRKHQAKMREAEQNHTNAAQASPPGPDTGCGTKT